MFKIFLPGIFLLIASCHQTTQSKSQTSLRDSIVQAHFATADSIEFYDTTNYDYRMLKAYIKNDTSYFEKLKEDLEYQKKRDGLLVGLDTCARVDKLSNLHVDEAYRFRHWESFCYFSQIITITRLGKKIDLHYVELSNGDDNGRHVVLIKRNGDTIKVEPKCKLIKNFHKDLSKEDWDNFNDYIYKADFWGLKQVNNRVTVMDGSDWIIEAFTSTPGSNNQRTHSVRRVSPENTDFQKLGFYFFKLAGTKTMCDDDEIKSKMFFPK